jgi:hypothetical protein
MPRLIPPDVVIGPDGELISRDCTVCGVNKSGNDFYRHDKGAGGRKSSCKDCDKARSRGRYEIPEVAARKRYTASLYSSSNLEVGRAKAAKYRSFKKLLPDTLTLRQEYEIRAAFNWACSVSGLDDKVELDHFIPLSWGHGGTYLGNMFPLDWRLNRSKHGINPFEWFNREHRVPVESWRFGVVVAYLAAQNGLTPAEFEDFVYWCEANKRDVSELEIIGSPTALNSLELWTAGRAAGLYT